jgi:hypothetical protein
MPESTTLTPTQQHVLALISTGATATAAAAAAGIHRNTIGNWLRSADFQQAFERALRDQALYWREQAAAIIPEALAVIRSIMLDPAAPAGARLKAAFAILDRNPEFRAKPARENIPIAAEPRISAHNFAQNGFAQNDADCSEPAIPQPQSASVPAAAATAGNASVLVPENENPPLSRLPATAPKPQPQRMPAPLVSSA